MIQAIADIERRQDPKLPPVAELSKSKRRELINKYPLFVAWILATRLELIIKAVVVPLFGACDYAAVFEWSPTGGMLHLHYILWKPKSPRFDLRSELLVEKAKELQRAGVVAGAETHCDMSDIFDYFNEYINEWNPNKDQTGDTLPEATDNTEQQDHPAALDLASLIALLQPGQSAERMKFYKRCVGTEHMHNWHYPDPHGPPASSQPCASLLKGTSNMYFCKNGYPRVLVVEAAQETSPKMLSGQSFGGSTFVGTALL